MKRSSGGEAPAAERLEEPQDLAADIVGEYTVDVTPGDLMARALGHVGDVCVSSECLPNGGVRLVFKRGEQLLRAPAAEDHPGLGEGEAAPIVGTH